MENLQDFKQEQDSFNIIPSQSSIDSGEESFVVLWKDGDSNGDCKSIKEVSSQSTSTGAVEAKSLISETQMKLEQLSFANEFAPQLENQALFNTEGLNNHDEKETTLSSQTHQLPDLSQTLNKIDTTGVISIPNISNYLTLEEVEQKISEIVEENIRLKDTILGNNNTMKLQYERIVKWQNDVQKVHEAHREKLIEAKDFIDKLKKENFNISRELEQLKANKKDLEDEINVLKKTLTEHSSISNVNDEERKEIQLKMKNLSEENAEDRARLMSANTKIQEFEKETDFLQKTLQTSQKELEEAQLGSKQMQYLHEERVKAFNEMILSLSTQLAATSQSQVAANSGTHLCVQIDNLNKEVFELKTKLDGTRAQTDEIFALKAQLELYKLDFETERHAKEAIKVEKEKVSEDFKKLQAQNHKLHEQIKSIRDNYIVIPRSKDGQGSTSSRRSITPDDPCFLQ